jgi:hypothetical protein
MEYFGVKVKVGGKSGTRTYYFLCNSVDMHEAVRKSLGELEFESSEVFQVDIQVIKLRDFLAVNSVKQWM